MGRSALAVSVTCLLAALVGCQARVIPLSAQAGSTVVIPFTGANEGAEPGLGPIGYGGTDYPDPQRGETVAQLGTTGWELSTRATMEAAPSTRANLAGRQMLLIADIPAGAPLGTHDLVLVNRRDDGGGPVDTPVTPAYQGSLTILPNSIDVDTGSGIETVVGSPTPTEYYGTKPLGGPVGWWQAAPFFAIPDPGFRLTVVRGQTDGSGREIASAVIEVSYPDAVISIGRVAAESPAADAVWASDDGEGTLTIHAAHRNGGDLGVVWVGFTLEGATPLDIAQVSTTLVKATDQFGDDAIQTEQLLSVDQSDIQ